MKTFLVGVLILVVASVSFAQNTPNDLATYFKVTKSGTQKIPWYTYSQGQLFVEARYNFDWHNATTLFIGRSIERNGATFIPEIGIIAGGGHRAISPEILFSTSRGKLSIFTLNQVAVSSTDPNFIFHFADFMYKVNSHLKVGFDEQAYYERSRSFKPDVDFGPVVKVSADGFYLKIWYSFNPTGRARKTFFGLGRVF